MSDGRVEFFPDARRELNEALAWYLERSQTAAEAFIQEVDRAVGVIVSAPGIWRRFEAGTRRYVLHRFPYGIIYREIGGGIEVVAVAHHKRRPRYWRDRLSR